nr:PAS-domain containing protein [Methanobacterium formicicum]
MARDITDLKLMEDSLQESLAIQEATLESVSNGIVVVNNHKKVICYNHKFLKMWNIPEELLESDENHVLNHISTSLEDPVEFQSIIKKTSTSTPSRTAPTF